MLIALQDRFRVKVFCLHQFAIEMLKKFRSFLTPPVFEDEEQTRVARLLFAIQLSLLPAIALASITITLLQQWQLALPLLVAGVFIGGTYWLTRRGKVGLAGFLLLLTMLATATTLLYRGQGIHDISTILLPIILLVASLLLDRQTFTFLAGLTILAVVGIVYAEITGRIHTDYSQFTDYGDLINVTILLGLAAVFVRLLADSLLLSLRRARQNEQVLVEANRQLEQQAQALKASEISLQRYSARMKILHEIDYAILAARHPGEIAAAALSRMRELVPSWRATVAEFDLVGQQAYILAASVPEQTLQDIDIHLPLDLFGELAEFRQGRHWYVPDMTVMQLHSEFLGQIVAEGTLSALSVPLLAQDELIGTLNLEGSEKAAFSAEHIEIAREVADLLAIAIRQARLLDETMNALDREQRLNAVARTISSTLDLDVLMENVARLAMDLLGADACTLSLAASDDESVGEIYDLNIPAPVGGTKLPKGEGLTWEIIATGRSILLDDYGAHPKALPDLVAAGMRAFIGVPLLVGGTCQGALILLSAAQDKRFNERDMTRLESIGRQVGVAIQNARLFSALSQELSERVRAEEALRESEALYRRAISAADAVPYYQDYEKDTYPFMGEGIQSLTGYFPEELTPQVWSGLIKDTVVGGEGAGLSLQDAIQKARSGEFTTWKCDYLIQGRDGQMRWIADTAVEIYGPDGVSHGSIGILQDVTDRKRAEEQIRSLNAELEERVRLRTAELEAANRELEAFAYSVSHDLRAPLRGIDGYGRLLLDEHVGKLDEEARFYLNNIRQATQQMGQLINDLLKLSRVTRAEMRRTQVNLSSMAVDVIADLRKQDVQRQIQVSIQPGLVVNGDENLLRIVLQNLLGNAWKFTGKTQQAHIEFNTLQRKGETIYYVRDNGAGFSMQYADKLFAPFQRLHGAQEFEGTGIGLATVKRIIHRHGGEIWAEAEIGKGATFYFTL
ncbi:MAG: GAF domain-containing protein [Chloroflexota bacterium]